MNRNGDEAPLPDAAVRTRIATDLESTLFVSAGAGSGKTTQLVDRVVALVRAGVAIESIAAITFTEKAADELRHRIRLALQPDLISRELEAAEDPGLRARFNVALDDLDQAAFCTLHAFAQRILTAFPVEAGLPPAVTVLDEIASDLDFDQRFQAFYADLLNRPELERTLILALELGITPAHLRAVAERFDDNWDRLEPVSALPPEPPRPDVRPLLAAGRNLLAECAAVRPGDLLAGYLKGWLPNWLAQLEAAAAPGGDELDLLDVLLRADPPVMRTQGTAAAWAATVYGSPKAARDAAKGLVDRTVDGSALAPVLDAVVNPILARLGAEITRFTLDQAARRSRRGRLTFHDLLVLCRRLLQDRSHGQRVRLELAQRFRALLLDEYQDTDPLQLDMVMAIATPPGASQPRPGQLFFVGDPKQSLYRFRRADIDLFLRTPAMVGAEGLSLTSNFRSTPALIAWINHVFDGLIHHVVTTDGTLAQPRYERLEARPAPELTGAPVTLLGVEPHPKGTRVGQLREAEAADVAAIVTRIRSEGWLVRGDHGAPAPARLGDIAVLIPARTALGQLEAALRRAGIPYRLDTGSLVYAADEIRALLLALRAIDDPSDRLALVSVLRSPLFGCSDVDLYRWRNERDGAWNPQAPRPPRLVGEDPVWDALADLEERIAARSWQTPSQQLDSLVRDRRVMELALAGSSPFDAWHRVRFVTEQARAWSDAGGRFLRDYLAWTRRQTGLTGRVAEAVLEDSQGDDDLADDHRAPADDQNGDDHGRDETIRILTVHGSKGLEFPITIVCGFNSPPGGGRRGVQVSFGAAGGPTLRMRDGLQQEGFDANRAIDEQMDEHERIRLLYVACTRARDHLVVSLHRVGDKPQTGAQLLAGRVTPPEHSAALTGIQAEQPAGAPVEPDPPSAPGPVPPMAVPDLARWRSDRARLVATARLPGSVSATGLAAIALREPLTSTSPPPAASDAPGDGVHEGLDDEGEDDDRFVELAGAPAADDVEPGLAKRPVDLDLPAWRKGALRHRDRSRRPRRAPGGGPLDGGRDRAAGEGAGHRRGHRGRARPHRAPGPIRPRGPERAGGRRVRALAGGVRRGAVRGPRRLGHGPRGVHRPLVPPHRRPRRRRPQDRRRGHRRAAGGEARRLPAPAGRLCPGHRAGHR